MCGCTFNNTISIRINHLNTEYYLMKNSTLRRDVIQIVGQAVVCSGSGSPSGSGSLSSWLELWTGFISPPEIGKNTDPYHNNMPDPEPHRTPGWIRIPVLLLEFFANSDPFRIRFLISNKIIADESGSLPKLLLNKIQCVQGRRVGTMSPSLPHLNEWAQNFK